MALGGMTMPGLFAVVSKEKVSECLLNEAIHLLRSEAWYATVRHDALGGSIALGRVSSGIVNID